ncbi:MAG: hypothetical protein HY763_14525 [Planctomycetes bacterium]|nr:hypothetical protein [Planctomycetota bacterium]
MSRQGTTPRSVGGPITGPLARADANGADDGRPFAEIRKNLQDALRIVSLHRWAFFVPCCLVSSGAFILSLYYPRTYTASTVFERRNDPIMVDLPNAAGTASFKYFRSTMERDITSTPNMLDVVDGLGLVSDVPPDSNGEPASAALEKRGALARSLAATVSVSTSSPSEHVDIVRLTYTGPDPRIGAKLLDEVKKTYIRRTMVWIREFLQSQRDYFDRALADAGEVLKAAQREEARLRLESPHVNPEDPGAIPTRLDQLEIERRELLLRRRELEADLAALQQLLFAADTAPPAIYSAASPAAPAEWQSPQTAHLMEQLRKINAEIERLRAARGMTDEHPEMREMIASLRWHESELAQQREADLTLAAPAECQEPDPQGRVIAALTPAGGATRSERTRLALQIGTLEAKIKDIDISLQTTELATRQLQTAKTEVYQRLGEFSDAIAGVARARQRYNELAATLARIDPAIKAIEQNRLLQFSEGEPARGSFVPVNPKATTIILLALLSGVAAGALFVVLAEVMDHVYRSSGQVARSLGLPILETIDVIITSRDRRRLLIEQTVVAPLILAGFLSLSAFTGTMAYLSIQRPWTFQRIREFPQAAMRLFAAATARHVDDQPPAASAL